MEAKKKKIIFQNVWRKFNPDSKENMQTTFTNDIKHNYDPTLIMKDEKIIEDCTNILRENIEIINLAFKEGIANSPETYPEISSKCFIDTIMVNQKGFPKNEQLPRAFIENCYIRATRGDGVKGLNGKLCRGEYLDVVLRLCFSIHPNDVSEKLPEFLNKYVLP